MSKPSKRQDGTPNKKGVVRLGRKRTGSQIATDRALIAELFFKGGLSDYAIAAELNAREGVSYTLSRRMISYEREQITKEYSTAHDEADTNFWMKEAEMRTYMVEVAAWKGWELSLKPRERKVVRSGFTGDNDFESVEELIEGNIGDKGFLRIILDAISERNRIRGIGATRLKIEARTEHIIKTYAIISPQDWDDPNIIPGEFEEQGALPSGES
jgi:hypothetical protein